MLVGRSLCCSLRTGVMLYSIFEIVVSVLNTIVFASVLFLYYVAKQIEKKLEKEGDLQAQRPGLHKRFLRLNKGFIITELVLTLVAFFSAVFKLIAVCTENEYFLLPYLITYPIIILISISYAAFTEELFVIILSICFSLIFGIYVWICVFSYWQELRGDGDDDDMQ